MNLIYLAAACLAMSSACLAGTNDVISGDLIITGDLKDYFIVIGDNDRSRSLILYEDGGLEGDPEMIVSGLEATGSLEVVVKLLLKTGKICEIKGHSWRSGRPGEGIQEDGYGVFYLDYHPGVFYRTCTICGKCQAQSLTDWK